MIKVDKNLGTTKLTGLIGYPVEHSKSPLMHNTAFEELGLDYTYELFEVKEDEVAEAFEDLKALGVAGFNCTMPDKIKAFELADEVSTAAKMIGAANTIVNKDGKFVAYNTDGVGFVNALRDDGFNVKDKVITILGSGGAASAIIVQCALEGAKEINVLSIKDKFWDKAQELADTIIEETPTDVNLIEMSDEAIEECVTKSSLLCNATPVGMAPNEDACIIKDSGLLRTDLVVVDIIYNPLETKLYQMAKVNGCKVLNGIEMLIFQGAASFELWTGEKFPIDKVREAVYKSIKEYFE
ncbi:MAG: shikimate dehydrogenase [Eubacterium sp.]|nr:shikimate dehydrogenase [Eubacterium sp.]